MTSDVRDRPLGVLAFGDSITNGGGELQWGVALQSWALWVARGLGLPFTGYAVDGANVRHVIEWQIPAFRSVTAHPEARYDLGCLYIGVNDVCSPDFDAAAFAPDFAAALEFLEDRCARTLTLTVPLDLGRPRAGAKVRHLDEAIESAAQSVGALVLDLRAFGGRDVLMADHIHPTALGQVAIAERALDVLERDGLRATIRPSSLISYQTTRWGRIRGDARYAYRRARLGAATAPPLRSLLAGARRARE